jgi:outer membrane autotransporter protein
LKVFCIQPWFASGYTATKLKFTVTMAMKSARNSKAIHRPALLTQTRGGTHSLLPFFGRWVGLVVVGAGALVHLSAAPTTWVHTNGNTSWFTATNWSAGVPTAADDAFLASGTTAFVQGSNTAVADNIYIDAGGLTIGNISAGTLTVNGELAVSANGSGGALNLNYGTLSVNRLSVGQNGSYSDNSISTLHLTGDNPTIAMASSITMQVNSLVTGTNGLTKAGLGTLILANNNTYSGGTTIEIGTLQIGTGGTSGTLGAGDVLNNGTLIFNRSDEFTVTNFISGTGNLGKSGSGTLILTADNTYSGGTIINAGTLQIGDGGTSGSLGSGNVTNNSTLAFNRSDDLAFANLISGSGNLVQMGSNILTLTANNTYTGSTTINSNSAIQVGAGGTTGTLGAGAVVNHGALIFNRSDALTVSNTISGTGNLTNAGSGTTILTANNTYSGLTVIADGTLQVGNGGTTGSLGTNQVINDGVLAFNRTNDLTVANRISGSGSLRHLGAGVLTLSGTNSYTGGTTVNGGGTLRLLHAAALGGGDFNLLNGELGAASTLTTGLVIKVSGDYLQSGDGTLSLRVGGGLAASNQFDQLNVDGSATLDGTLHVRAFNNYLAKHSDSLELITAAGGVSGTFSTFTNDITHSVLLSPELVYESNRVMLIWEHMLFTDFLKASNVTLTANQQVIAAALDDLISSTHTNDVALIHHLDYLADLTNSLPRAFAAIAPEELTAMVAASFAALDTVGQQFRRRASDLQADYQRMYQTTLGSRTTTRAAFDDYVNRPWDVYFEMPLNSITYDGDANAGGYDLAVRGFTLGTDHRVSPNLFVGGALNHLQTKADLTLGGSVELTSLGAQIYATWFEAGWHFEGMLGVARNSYDTERASLNGRASGNTDGFGVTSVLGGGYHWENGPWQFGPNLALQIMATSIDEFTETGSLAPLRIASQTETALASQLGFKLRYRHLIPDSWTFITPELSFAWRHEFLDDPHSLDARFGSGGGGDFSVTGPATGSESVVIGLGCAIQWKPEFNTHLGLTMQRGRNGYDSQYVNLGVRYNF